MKKEQLLLSMNFIDEKYIDEAKPNLSIRRKKKKIIILAACISLLFSLCLFLFIPYSAKVPGIFKYSGNEYYDIIDKLNIYYYKPPKFKNNFEALVGGISNIFLAARKEVIADDNTSIEPEGNTVLNSGVYPTDSNNDGDKYEEVTDNQVNGVIEGDLFKRSDKYIYYLDGNVLRVYSIAGMQSKEVGAYSLESVKDYYEDSENDMIYLSEDCTTVTVILNYYNYKNGLRNTFSVISLDVTDPADITQKSIVEYEGRFVSARLNGGKLYIISNFLVNEPEDYNQVKEYIPSYRTEGGEEIVSADHIYYPDVLSNAGYTVLTKLNEKTLDIEADYALLSFYNPVIYASGDSFYFARNYKETTQDGKYTVTADMTEICRIDYSGEGFENLGSVTVQGNINDQYSIDEYNGILRVFTSINLSKHWQTLNGGMYGISTDQTGINASLYCIDINTLKVVSSVERFAPKGESVKSARFDKDTAYVCTAVELTDPVFFFDLSNLNNITFKETGTVEGFSTSLVDFGEGYLLGIGQKNWNTPKIEVYKEEEGKIISVTAIEMPNSHISTDYKSYYIDRKNGYIGIGVSSYNYNSNNNRYVIFKYENEELTVAYELVCDGDTYRMRGTYIDEYIYVLSHNNLKVIAESELK